MGVTPSDSNSVSRARENGLWQGLLAAVMLFCVAPSWAQALAEPEPTIAEEPPEWVDQQLLPKTPPPLDLPEIRHLAASMSDPDSRNDTLMTMVAVWRLLRYAEQAPLSQAEKLAQRFGAERDWLDQLSARYEQLPMRGSLFDPAAWFLLQELDQYELIPDVDASPLGPATASLMEQLFDRSDQAVAATLLPEVLSRIEIEATTQWHMVLGTVSFDPTLEAVMRLLNEEWFDLWRAAEPPAPVPMGENLSVVEEGALFLQDLAAGVTRAGPPHALRLKRLRFGLHMALPELGILPARDAGYLLILAGAVNGLYVGQYLPFTESLLWVATALLLEEQARLATVEEPPPPSQFDVVPVLLERLPGEEIPPEPYQSPLPRALSDLLPAVSSSFSAEFSRVDPRIDGGLATVFEVAQYFQGDAPDADQLRILLSETADVVAQLVLLIPDMSYYFDQPVRGMVAEGIVACIDRAARTLDAEMDPVQFDACVQGLTERMDGEIRAAELAGDPDGPFGSEQLRRELMLTPWQRINFVLGYLQGRYATGCEALPADLPNPLEWASMVNVLDWFVRRSPENFRAQQYEQLVLDMRINGLELLAALSRQIDCISGSGSGVNDPVQRALGDYRQALDALIGGLRQAELEFREIRLKPGADVVLTGGPQQSTAYRPEDLFIGPCDARYVCEMSGELQVPPYLLSRFPEPYLVADQSGLGEVQICYDNVQWVSRRSEPVREDDPHVANYYGRLSFDLVGRYREGEESTHVFGFNFISPDEYHYLFAAASEEVLNDSCPTEWVGSRMVTGLGRQSLVRVVPDRLTYLAAARSQPSQLFSSNWARNQEWQNAFALSQGVRAHQYEADSTINERVERHLQGLYQAEQSSLFNALFTPRPRSWRSSDDSLHTQLLELTDRKSLARTYINLLYPQFMVDSDEIRGALEGHDALIDEAVMRRFRQQGQAVTALQGTALERLERLNTHWNRQPDSVRRTGSVATSIAHALARLAALYQDFFVAPPPAPEPPPLSFEELSG